MDGPKEDSEEKMASRLELEIGKLSVHFSDYHREAN